MIADPEILARLDELTRQVRIGNALAALAVCGDRPQKEKIALLATAGFAPKQIAEMLGTTRNTVNVALVAIRKERHGKKSRKAADRAAKDET